VIYQCCDEKRKAAVLGNPTLNGIDYLEVLGFDAEPLGLQPQTILMVRCLKAVPAGLKPNNVIIAGGESITNITATFVTPASTPPPSMTATQKNYFTSLPIRNSPKSSSTSRSNVRRSSTVGRFLPLVRRICLLHPRSTTWRKTTARFAPSCSTG